MKPFDIIVSHALATLPDSLSKRKVLLGAILDAVTVSHPARRGVSTMLMSLEDHERAQAELDLDFANGAKPKKGNGKPGHDGHHNGGDAE